MVNLTSGWAKSGPFFPEPRHFFDFQKRVGDSPPLSYMPDMKDLYSRIME